MTFLYIPAAIRTSSQITTHRAIPLTAIREVVSSTNKDGVTNYTLHWLDGGEERLVDRPWTETTLSPTEWQIWTVTRIEPDDDTETPTVEWDRYPVQHIQLCTPIPSGSPYYEESALAGVGQEEDYPPNHETRRLLVDFPRGLSMRLGGLGWGWEEDLVRTCNSMAMSLLGREITNKPLLPSWSLGAKEVKPRVRKTGT
jgi:hypothetical protein